MRTAVIDSSALINLTHLNLIPELSLFFARVYVPRAVQLEVNKKGRFRYRLNNMYEGSVLARCLVVDDWNVRLLQPELHAGEAEAIIQAQEQDAEYFIGDEQPARNAATRMRRKAVGTLGILARLNLHGRAPEYQMMVDKLRRDLHFRATDKLVREAAERATEPI